MVEESTLTDSAGNGEPARAVGAPQLIILLAADRPLHPTSRHLMEGIDRVSLGRGDQRSVSRRNSRGLRLLDVRLDDRKASTEHAQIERVGANRWAIHDSGAKNGVYVNGDRVPRAMLIDGDVIEIGNTFLLYRDAVPPVQFEQPDVDADALDAPAPELRSFVFSLAHMYRAAGLAARSTTSLVILGESGTGKEVVARAIHCLSGRTGAFVAVNCGSIPPTLIEATLLGHRKGAFSDATEDRPGVVRAADGGTLFLDEIGDLPLSSQAAFLRVLQDGEVIPVGDTRPVRVDLRLISATNHSMKELVDRGDFRSDLFARLIGVTLRLPRLADRREDLGLLIGSCLTRMPSGGRKISFTRAAARQLVMHDWPLNVRELHKVLGAAATLAGGGAIDVGHLADPLDVDEVSAAPREAISERDQRVRAELVALLREHRGNVAAVAKSMSKGRMQIHRWVKRFGLTLDEYRR